MIIPLQCIKVFKRKAFNKYRKYVGGHQYKSEYKSWRKTIFGQLSFLLRASSDTLPTAINLHRWKIQCGARCILCDSSRPTTAHVLSGCPVALSQHTDTRIVTIWCYSVWHLSLLVFSIIYHISRFMQTCRAYEPVNHLQLQSHRL